jgi:hypothetical protein
MIAGRARARGVRTLLGALVLLASARCGGQAERADLDPLRVQGEAGAAAVALIEAHGGLPAYLALRDLEYDLRVERFDPAGVVVTTSTELHRFQTAPPSRYLVRRRGRRVSEIGLHGESAWVRQDGILVEDAGVAEEARTELELFSMLSRAPFGLADPGVSVSLMPDGPAAEGSGAVRRLAIEVRSESGRLSRYVYFVDRGTGRLASILFEARGSTSGAPLRLARARDYRTEQGTVLVASWELQAAGETGHPIALPDLRWTIERAEPGTGFTEELYRPTP